jgi:hypothetical protein
LDKLAEEEGGFLTWLSPFKNERKKTPEELEAEDPHDDIYRKEIEEAKRKLYLRLNPPEVIVEEEKFQGFGPAR